MIKQEWTVALRVVHLLGGLYAVNPPQEDEVHLSASSPPDYDNILCSFTIPAYDQLFFSLHSLGLKPLGTMFVSDKRQQEGIYPPTERHYYCSSRHQGPWVVWDAMQTWGQIARHSAEGDANIPLMDLARRISFELYACSAKWFELSHAYGDVLNGQVRIKELHAGQRFETMNSLSVYLAIHSLLSEISSLRDYLAEFAAQHLLTDDLPGNPYTKMSKLINALKKRPDITHPVARTIRDITSESGGWLSILSAYRDLVIHHAPAGMTQGWNFMVQKEFEIRGGFKLPYIETYLPSDPIAVKKERSRGTSMRTLAEWNRAFSDASAAGGPDALIYLHDAVGKLALLSLGMALHSPVKPGPTEVDAEARRLTVMRIYPGA